MGLSLLVVSTTNALASGAEYALIGYSTGSGTAPSHTVTAGGAGDVRIAGVWGSGWATGIIVGAGETSRVEVENISAYNFALGICTKEDNGSDAMNWTPSTADTWGMRGFNINQAAAGGTLSVNLAGRGGLAGVGGLAGAGGGLVA